MRWLLVICVLFVLPANAQTLTQISIHTGTEAQNDLRWRMISLNRTVESLAPSNPLPLALHRLITRDQVSASLGVNLSKVRLSKFNQARYDASLIPSLHYAFNRRVRISGGLGIAYNDLDKEESTDVRLKLGGNWFFAPEIKLVVVLTQHSRPLLLELAYGHRSNAGLAESNSGLDIFTLGLGARF